MSPLLSRALRLVWLYEAREFELLDTQIDVVAQCRSDGLSDATGGWWCRRGYSLPRRWLIRRWRQPGAEDSGTGSDELAGYLLSITTPRVRVEPATGAAARN